MALTVFSVMIVLLLLGFPMMIPLLAGSLTGFLLIFGDFGQLETGVQQIVAGIRPASLIAVPMFIFAADIMTRGQSAGRLIDMVMSFVGHIKGGLAVATASACTMFGAVSGSTQATVVAVGSPLRPRMLQAGYKDSFVLALIVTFLYSGYFMGILPNQEGISWESHLMGGLVGIFTSYWYREEIEQDELPEKPSWEEDSQEEGRYFLDRDAFEKTKEQRRQEREDDQGHSGGGWFSNHT